MFWLILAGSAMADTFTLDNEAILEGLLAEYNLEGSCQIALSEGELSGAIVVLPCARIMSFTRSLPPPIIEEEAVALTAPALMLDPVASDAAHAQAPVEVIIEDPSPPEPEPEPEVVAVEEEEPAQAEAEPAEPPAVEEKDDGRLSFPSLPNLRLLRQKDSSGAKDQL